jgi:hypothetical protein
MASASTGQPEKPRSITCEVYEPDARGRRCVDYESNGACRRPDRFMCSEWLRANGLVAAAPVAAPVAQARPEPQRPQVALPAPGKRAAAVDLARLRGFTTDDIDSFRRLNVEVCLSADGLGDVWLVPAYTGGDRQELTPENAATLLGVLALFPGARVVRFNKRSDVAAAETKSPAAPAAVHRRSVP